MPATTTAYRLIKSRQQLAWSTSNYAVFGATLQSVGENLCEALDIRAGSRVLDVAAARRCRSFVRVAPPCIFRYLRARTNQ